MKKLIITIIIMVALFTIAKPFISSALTSAQAMNQTAQLQSAGM